MCLTFVLPGQGDKEIELKPKGKTIEVTEANLSEYLDLVLKFTLDEGVRI